MGLAKLQSNSFRFDEAEVAVDRIIDGIEPTYLIRPNPRNKSYSVLAVVDKAVLTISIGGENGTLKELGSTGCCRSSLSPDLNWRTPVVA